MDKRYFINGFDEDTRQLCDDLVTWLPTVLPSEIIQYGRALPEEFWYQIELFQPILIDNVVEYRNRFLKEFLATNAYLIMNQVDILEFVRALAIYNQASVIENFKQEYPTLEATSSNADLVSWAKSMIVLWNNTFYFLSFKNYLDYSIYLKSILKLRLTTEQFTEAHTETANLLRQVSELLFESNFSNVILPAQLGQDLMAYFSALSFFPKEYILKLVMGTEGTPLFTLLTALEYVFGVLKSVTEARSTDWTNEQLVSQILWDLLASDLEKKMMLKEDGRKIEHELVNDPTVTRDDLPQKLAELLTVQNIDSGYCSQYLHQYIALLNPEQKGEFRTRLITFFNNSPLMQTLFDKVDVDFFFTQIGPGGKGRSKQDFINGLAEFVDPALWPVSQKLMLLLASTI